MTQTDDPLPEDRWRRVQELFETTVELPADREDDALREACTGDEDLRRRVAELSAHHADDAEGIDRVVAGAADRAAGPVPERIGPYRVLRQLGSGGMGTVYLAERADGAFDKRVVIKRIRAGEDPSSLRTRFERERRVLASLEHPCIARVLDGGTYDIGRPYVVMEDVDGRPLTAACDERRLGVEERLRLFIRVLT